MSNSSPGKAGCHLRAVICFALETSDAGFHPDIQDPWPGSRRQVGHFLTAVQLGFAPEDVQTGLRGLEFAATGSNQRSLDEVAIISIVGHEMAPDPTDGPLRVAQLPGHVQRQFQRGVNNPAAIQAFRAAYRALGPNGDNWAAAERELSRVPIDRRDPGASRQDLKLSLQGYWLGRQIREGRMTSPAAAAAWIRRHMRDPNDPPRELYDQ